jgi:transcriptional regulator GlxA family with amidase domain
MSRQSPAARRRIGFLVFDGIKMLDLAGPAEVFVEANQSLSAYDVVLVSPDGRDVTTSIGARVGVRCAAGDAGRFDTVIIPGSELPADAFCTPEVLAAARTLAAGARRLTSICSRAFVVAEPGFLDGRRATTHWKFTKDLARRSSRRTTARTRRARSPSPSWSTCSARAGSRSSRRR